MKQAASAVVPTQDEIDALNKEYRDYIEWLKRAWMRENNRPQRQWTLYELDADERARVHGVIHSWERYVTPLAERWWRQRGFGILWPKDSSDPCQIYKLESASAISAT